jgi:CDP-6-deoxy-D-xylo-4-hexulose-3-dehydrase
MGEEVFKFESEFAEKLGAKYAVMTNSGSSANLVLLAALKYMKNSRLPDHSSIIVPAVSWSTTYYPIHQLGFVLSFIDIDGETLNMDIDKVEAAIKPNTKAILAVNLLGNPSDLNALRIIAEKYNLLLIEDNCESLGSKINGKFSGTFGLAGSHSSFFSHHISTMEGGIVVTDDLELSQVMKSLRAHGWTRGLPKDNFVHPMSGLDWEDLYRFILPGYNLRPIEFEGAIGRSQIKKLDTFITSRRQNAMYLLSFSKALPRIQFQKEFGESSWFGFSLLLQGELKQRRSELLVKLTEAGIETRPIVGGNFTKNPVMKYLRHEELPSLKNADQIHESGLFVGNHHFSITTQIDRLVEVLIDFESAYE